jgi:hypothetical protein
LILAFACGVSSCAATVALDAKDRVYVRGLESFRDGRCAEAHETLTAFERSSCSGPQPESGCQRAAWTKILCDLKEGRPGRAIVDARSDELLGPPRPELDPSVSELRARARAALDGAWASADHSGKLAVTFGDDTTGAYQLSSIAVSLDLRPGSYPGSPAGHDEVPVFDTDIPPGNHVLVLAVRFTADLKRGRYTTAAKSAQTFTVKAGESVRIKMRTYLRNDGPPLAGFPDLLALDFQVTPESAKP